jgi:hypothetical protein
MILYNKINYLLKIPGIRINQRSAKYFQGDFAAPAAWLYQLITG